MRTEDGDSMFPETLKFCQTAHWHLRRQYSNYYYYYLIELQMGFYPVAVVLQ
jgi:hypothetical protein